MEQAAAFGGCVKVLFFLLDGDTNASSYLRVLQYLPLLRQHGIEPHLARPVPQPLYERLVENSEFGMKEKVAFYGLFLLTRLLDVLRAGRYDAVVIQRDLFPFGPPWLEALLFKINPHVVYDTDDPVYLKPSFTPNTIFQRLRRYDKVAHVVRRARWTSVSTEAIARWARQYNPSVAVVPMVLSMPQYDTARANAHRTHSDKVVLGWSGTGGSVQYLESLASALRRVAETHPIEVRVISGAWEEVHLRGVPLDARPWSADTVLAEMAEFDIGLTPLHDLEFEREKFPSKALQYMALGIPVVASKVGIISEVIVDAQNGLLATTEDEWVDRLTRLVSDAQLRHRLGRAGLETVRDRFTVEKTAPVLAEGLRLAAS